MTIRWSCDTCDRRYWWFTKGCAACQAKVAVAALFRAAAVLGMASGGVLTQSLGSLAMGKAPKPDEVN